MFTVDGRSLSRIGGEALKHYVVMDITVHGQILMANCESYAVAVFDRDGMYSFPVHIQWLSALDTCC